MKQTIAAKIIFLIGFLIIFCVEVFADSYKAPKMNLSTLKQSSGLIPVKAKLEDRYREYDYTDNNIKEQDLNRIPSSNKENESQVSDELPVWRYTPTDD